MNPINQSLSTLDYSNSYWATFDGGKIYGSRKQALVAADDKDYVAWLASGRQLLAWPVDAMGFQTDDALQQVLAPANRFVSLAHYVANRRWRAEQAGMVTTAGFPIHTDDRAQTKITGLYIASGVNSSAVTAFSASDGTVHQLDAGGMRQLYVDLLTHINACFDVSAKLKAQVDAGAVTTREAVDAEFSKGMTEAQKNWLKP